MYNLYDLPNDIHSHCNILFNIVSKISGSLLVLIYWVRRNEDECVTDCKEKYKIKEGDIDETSPY